MKLAWIVLVGLLLASSSLAQQSGRLFADAGQSPCEEVRSILAQNAADLATQVRTVSRENEALKAKLAEMEKKMKDGEKPVEMK